MDVEDQFMCEIMEPEYEAETMPMEMQTDVAFLYQHINMGNEESALKWLQNHAYLVKSSLRDKEMEYLKLAAEENKKYRVTAFLNNISKM